jgi:hypothetical protein
MALASSDPYIQSPTSFHLHPKRILTSSSGNPHTVLLKKSKRLAVYACVASDIGTPLPGFTQPNPCTTLQLARDG